MARMLLIDTATDQASVGISENGILLDHFVNPEQKSHAFFLQPSIQQILKQNNLSLAEMDAIAVTNGPGSYTGLRVGLASAKGICYALDKPLIALNTLQVIAASAKTAFLQLPESTAGLKPLFCPLIDARRMEVFTGLYQFSLSEMETPKAFVLDTHSFENIYLASPVVFCGSGHYKLKPFISHSNALFLQVSHTAKDMIVLAEEAFDRADFANLAYCEPLYIKPFFDTSKAAK